MSVTVVVVDPAPEADAALGLRSEPPRVEELVGEGAVEPLSLAVGLGSVGTGSAVHGPALGEHLSEGVGAEVTLVDRSGLAGPQFEERGIAHYPMATYELLGIDRVEPAAAAAS